MKRYLVVLLALASLALAFQISRSRSDAPSQFDLGSKRFPRPPAFKELFDPEEPVPEPPPDPRISGAIRLTDDTRSNDFPDIVSDPRDRSKAWCVWQSYSGRQDQVRLAYFDGKDWGTWVHVPGVSGDVWRPKLAFDGRGRLWIVWSQQVDGNFDLYARSWDGTQFGPIARITSAPQSDFDARLASAPDGRIWVAWQGFRNGQSDIFLSSLEGDRWTPELRVSESARNDWGPAIAVDSAGAVYIAWDTYDKGNYDVVMRAYAKGKLSPVIPVAATPRLEAHPSLAAGRDGRIWIAYEAGPVNWGKDQGRMVPEESAPGTLLMAERSIEVVAYSGSRRLGMAPEIAPLLPRRNPKYPVMSPDPIFADPQLLVDDNDRLHLLLRNQEGLQNATYWWEYCATLTPAGWSKPAPLPFSAGRNSMRAALAPGPDGAVWISWPRDNDPRTSIWRVLPEETYIENVYAGIYRPESASAGALPLEDRQPVVHNRPAGHSDEDARVRAIRAYRANNGLKPLRILRGDLHRHSEFSPDLRGMPDGSALDFYRYMLDAASMDFGILSDHMAGGDREYWWWLSEKFVDLFHSPPNYVSLYGYERSVSYPQGHRNIIHTRRGLQPVPFFQKPGFPIRTHNSASEVIDNDTKLLYEEIRRTGGISIPHTSASQMGTDWRDNDRKVEPLVEIFQGDRYSAECKGCPKADPGTRPEGSPQLLTSVEAERPAGYLDQAWAIGYRLGVIASSDHFSTHISYALVYAEATTREAIQNAMRLRHAYAATDNIIVDFHMGEHFMGDDFTAVAAPEIVAKITGTAPVTEMVLIRNNRAVYQTAPNKVSAELRYRDVSPVKGLNWYYLRAQQADGQIVWSSPIWMTLK